MTYDLLIDAGNTRIKWALAAPAAGLGDWLAQGAHMHAEAADFPPALSSALAAASAGAVPAIGRVLVANVAGQSVRDMLAGWLAAPQLRIQPPAIEWFASIAQRAGVRNAYRNPAQLGCDRFAAAIGAHALCPGKAIVVANCGTATTIDAITADGTFLGGMILPGLGLMATSLARNTAQLPQIKPGKLPEGFADNTDDAILSGCLAAQAGAIERAFELHQAVECIISGGAAPYVAPAVPVPHRHVENIVMIGLHAALRSA
ncbi:MULTISPECIES: type III pantothenate kinase [unclassified Duganella]|uniref:type III pantothenate kinase n=1 Tax=unclassified Duganella TaxID=2636909 RepID=UPI0006FAB591|nr:MULTISPECIES: type III pantothenate kinase [unclassified Duganella]KQV55046.1 type III pantothenate kinase [Duganella sp. Root336D2]KRB94337.1 type III pantothenate kinase [Duganella sp. Root198D2]